MYKLEITLKTNNSGNFVSVPKILQKLKEINILKKLKINIINIPSDKKKIFTVLKSPHVYKKSREQFKYALYKKKLNIESSDVIPILYFNLIIKNYLPNSFNIYSKIIKN